MTIFVEIHALRGFPPSNLNRDDLGAPKTAVFGGVRRLRISSQCLKRTWRTSGHFRGAFAEDQLGLRTDRLPEEVLRAIEVPFDDDARAGLLALLGSIGRRTARPSTNHDDGAEQESSPDDSLPVEARTAHLLFLSRQEIEAIGAFARENEEKLRKATRRNRPEAEVIKALRKQLKEYLEKHTSKNAVDVGLFGRFITSDELDTVDGALQVAHGLGTQKVELEYDYFTAVDDLMDGSSAGHLGETEFASSVVYLYACCNLAQLAQNLGARSKDGRTTDEEALALARRSLPPLVRAMAEATPRGKQTGTAPHTPAEYVEVVIRNGAPLSFANAFSRPVDAREKDGDVMAASVQRLADHRRKLETAYGRDQDALGRFVLCLPDVEHAIPEGSGVHTIRELSEKLAGALEAVSVMVTR